MWKMARDTTSQISHTSLIKETGCTGAGKRVVTRLREFEREPGGDFMRALHRAEDISPFAPLLQQFPMQESPFCVALPPFLLHSTPRL